MITDGEKWHYLAVKNLSALFRRITSKHDGDFYFLNCFQSYTPENKLKKHKKVCENHDYYYVEMPEQYNTTLKYNEGEKSIKSTFIIYADLECLPEKPSTTKVNKHAPSGYSLFTLFLHCLFIVYCSFDTTKNKLD